MSDLKRIITDYRLRTDKAYQTACKILSDKVKDRTPELSGDLRESWVTDPPPETLRVGDTFRMGSDSPYIAYIEYLAPPARNPQKTKYADIGQPYGMYRRSIAEWQQIVDTAVRRHGS